MEFPMPAKAETQWMVTVAVIACECRAGWLGHKWEGGGKKKKYSKWTQYWLAQIKYSIFHSTIMLLFLFIGKTMRSFHISLVPVHWVRFVFGVFNFALIKRGVPRLHCITYRSWYMPDWTCRAFRTWLIDCLMHADGSGKCICGTQNAPCPQSLLFAFFISMIF